MDAKKAMLVVAAGLVLFYVATNPNQAATAVQGLLDWLGNGLVAFAGLFGVGGA